MKNTKTFLSYMFVFAAVMVVSLAPTANTQAMFSEGNNLGQVSLSQPQNNMFANFIKPAHHFDEVDLSTLDNNSSEFKRAHSYKVRQAIKNNDYTAWYDLLKMLWGEDKVDEVATQELFDRLHARYLKRAERIEAYKTNPELKKKVKRVFKRYNKPELTEEQIALNTAIQEAIEAGDYEAWKLAVEKRHAAYHNDKPSKLLELINADNFDEYAKMKQLRKEARQKIEEARAIQEKLGLLKRR